MDYSEERAKLKRRVYVTEDLMPLLGIGRSTAYNLVNQKSFPVVRVGRRILIPRDAFERWLEIQTEDALNELRGGHQFG